MLEKTVVQVQGLSFGDIPIPLLILSKLHSSNLEKD